MHLILKLEAKVEARAILARTIANDRNGLNHQQKTFHCMVPKGVVCSEPRLALRTHIRYLKPYENLLVR
jgi:hypothetical protein